MEIAFLILMFVLGTCFGSFFCCEARRMHHKEISKKKLPSRSVCLKCGYKLKWYDNIPLVSWLSLKGKCRKCSKKIGIGEFISELSVGFAFFLLALGFIIVSPEARFGEPPLLYINITLIIILVLSLLFLAVYDGLYGELPTILLTISIICAIIIVSISDLSWEIILNYAASVAILGGIYLLLYLVSKGKWVGDGDWLLGVAIGLTLKTPWLSLVALFLSNFIACLVMLPFSRGKNVKIPFGPFLVASFIIVYSFADMLMNML